MPTLKNIRLDTISPSGSLIQYDRTELYNSYQLTGGGGNNLSSGITVQLNPSDAPVEGLVFPIFYDGDVVYTGGNTISIFGRVLTATEARNILDINAVYTGGAWEVDIQYVRSQVTATYQISTGGGTDNGNFEDVYSFLLAGSGTLSSSYTFQVDPSLPTPTTPLTIRVLYSGQFALNGNSITILGLTLTSEQALKGAVIVESTYDTSPGASGWRPVMIESDYDSPYLNEGVEEIALAAVGGTFSLNPALNTINQNITGNDTLVGNVSIIPAGSPRDGDRFEFKYAATMTANGFSTTIFGVTLNDAEMLAGDVWIVAVYDLTNTAWITQKLRAPQYNQKEILSIPLSWETNEIGTISVPVPYAFRIDELNTCVSTTMDGVTDGDIAIDIAGASTTPSTTAIPSGSAVGTAASLPVTSNNTGALGQVINLTTSSATSGRCLATLTLKRVP